MDILSYLDEQIEQSDFPGDLNINWDKEIRSFEIEILMTGQTNELEIEDQEGDTQAEEVNYDDAILIYDEQKVAGQDYAENYLATIPFAGRKGIEKAVLQGLVTYLTTLLDDGMNDFLDFLDPDLEVATFQLAWSTTDFEAAVAAARANGATGYYSYPKY
ncbi:DUF3013 family protein [Lapidilactobacillus luobeiensis]|uniref:DUF3013 family protein n=1 Tax=Lapidilactobacillus luobeiensis TaxID=2950371 RepID=UPI0021C2CEE4|nr:DUF3013 family protein [Lapidilactobacillus luobeiensis]